MHKTRESFKRLYEYEKGIKQRVPSGIICWEYGDGVIWAYETIEELEKIINNIQRDTGGHFCPDWDCMFILPGSREILACTCNKKGDA